MFIYKVFIDGIEDVCYVGSSVNLKNRLTMHASLLKNNNHFNYQLQDAYNNSLSKKVILEKISETTEDNRYLDEYNEIIKQGKVYNLYINESKNRFGDVIKNHPKKKEIVDKIINSIKKRNSLLSEEEKRNLWGRFGSDNPNWRGGTSKSYCECGNEKALTANTCGNCRDRSGKNNPFFGKKHSEETIRKIAEANKGRVPVGARKVMVNDVKYESATAAARALNCATATILNRINGKKEGYSFVL